MHLGLEAMQEACARMGHPERAFPTVHVAGTNGKGSVCSMVESIARAQGHKTGLYTSPHLCRFAERIAINGEPIEDAVLARLLTHVLDGGPELSFFEAATLAAFLAFRETAVDVAVIEVGMGGRLDATNVIPTPRAAAITRIAFDHTDRLGTTLVDIAREKAAIAKPGLDIVLGPMSAEVRAAIDEVVRAGGATTSSVDTVPAPARVGLSGRHQEVNARIASALGSRLGITPGAIDEGLARVTWPGRLERIGKFLLDAAHNPDGAEALAQHLRDLAKQGLARPPDDVGLVFGTLADKDWMRMLEVLSPLAATRCFVAPDAAGRGAVSATEMAARCAGEVARSMPQALARFQSANQGPSLVVVAGSIVLVGQARALLLGLACDPPVSL